MNITITKTHQTDHVWYHAGTAIDNVDETRAKELIRNGLAVETIEKKQAHPAPNKQEPAPQNKMAPDPKNKAGKGGK